MCDVVTIPGCFYIIVIQSTHNEFDNFEIVDESLSARREICWLTDPLPPALVKRSATSVYLNWLDPVFCGMKSMQFSGQLLYTLQAAEGVEWKPGVVRLYSTDYAGLKYKVVCRGNSLTSAGGTTWSFIVLFISQLIFQNPAHAHSLLVPDLFSLTALSTVNVYFNALKKYLK